MLPLLKRLLALGGAAALALTSSAFTTLPAQAAAPVGGQATVGRVALPTAQTCSGVWVVVDFGSLGGGTRTACATSHSTGLDALRNAGFDPVVNNGMVSRLSGKPSRPDINRAFWSYWQATKTNEGFSDWTFSNLGAGATKPEQGNAEGWSYVTLNASNTPPSVKPPTADTTSPTEATSPEAAAAAAKRAGDYIVSTFGTSGATRYGAVGSAAASLIALIASGDTGHAEHIAGILEFLKKNAAATVKPDASGTTGAANLALAAAAAKADAKSFGGVDLVAEVKQGIGSDGSFGAFPGPFASGLAMVALARNGEQVPDSMVDFLLRYAEPRSGETGGGFGCATYPFKADGDCPAADPDSTAMAVLGLQASGSEKATKAADDALAWLAANQQADGSWKNFSPVNSTGLAGPLFPAGSEQATRATAYVLSKQLDSGALTTGVDDKANLLATQQGMFALTGTTYATVGSDLTASPSPSPTGGATATPSPQPSAPATPSGTDPAVGWTVGALVLLALGGAAVAASRNRTT